MGQQHQQDTEKMGFGGTIHAVVTDVHFVIPLVVLLLGIALLVALH